MFLQQNTCPNCGYCPHCGRSNPYHQQPHIFMQHGLQGLMGAAQGAMPGQAAMFGQAFGGGLQQAQGGNHV